jgi:hypothetical protein
MARIDLAWTTILKTRPPPPPLPPRRTFWEAVVQTRAADPHDFSGDPDRLHSYQNPDQLFTVKPLKLTVVRVDSAGRIRTWDLPRQAGHQLTYATV